MNSKITVLTRAIVICLIGFFSLPSTDAHAWSRGGGQVCAFGSGGWMYRVTQYVSDGINVGQRWSEPDGYHNCRSRYNKGKLIEDLYAFRHGKTDDMYVKGDMCAAHPTYVRVFDKRYVRPISVSDVRPNDQRFRNAPHDLYVLWRPDLVGRYWNDEQRRLVEFLTVVEAQCGKTPKSVRIIGRTDTSIWRPRPPHNRDAPKPVYTYRDFFGATLYPDGTKTRVEYDDKQLAALYADYSRNRLKMNMIARDLKQRRVAQGALLMAMFAYGVYSTSPCHDPNASAGDRALAECR